MNGNFCKGAWVRKFFVGTNVPSWSVATKKSLVILIFVKPSSCWVLLRDNMLMDAFRLCIITYTIDLLTHAFPRLATRLSCLCPLWKIRRCLRLSSLLIALFICICRVWSFYPACRTTGVENTYWLLTGFPFKLGVNNSLPSQIKIFTIKIAEFLFLYCL